MSFARTYAPTQSKDVPQDTAVKRMKAFVEHFAREKKKALLLHGPPGCGKTSSVEALAQELGHELVETNASETRNADAIVARVGAASKQQSLFGGGKLILIDEVDGISGSKDRGGVAALGKLIQTSAHPIIMTANDPWKKSLQSLRKKVVMVRCDELSSDAIVGILQSICERESLTYDALALKGLARRSGGDLRAAIHDLEILTVVSKNLTRESLDLLGERDREEQMQAALFRILKATDPSLSLEALHHVAEPLDQCMLWLDENIPKEYKKAKDLARAYDALSKADRFYGRIRRWQHWRFLTYVSAHLTAGVSTAKDTKYPGFHSYAKPQRILKYWIAKQKYRRRDALATKIAEHLSCSQTSAIRHTLPFLPYIVQASQHDTWKKDLDFDQEDLSWLESQRPRNP